MPINCACDDAPSYRTLAQLRTAITERMGFATPLGAPTTRTLLQVRTSMLYLLGYGAQVSSPGPGVAATLNTYINEAQQALFRRLELDRGAAVPPPFMETDAASTVLDYQPIQTLALAMYCAHAGRPQAKAYFEQHEKYVADVAARRPPGLVPLLNGFITEAQATLLRRFPQIHTARWFSWPLTLGERFYDLTANVESPACTKKIDPLRIDEVWLERGTERYRLRQGVPSALVQQTVTGWPSHYEVRSCIEVWPAPGDSTGVLRVKAHQLPGAFAADADVPVVDDHAVYLLALANGKAHFKQPDAREVMGQLEVYLQNLVAGTHQGARYIPGRAGRPDMVYVEPRPSVPFS